jgi:hypothetical protein
MKKRASMTCSLEWICIRSIPVYFRECTLQTEAIFLSHLLVDSIVALVCTDSLACTQKQTQI